MAERPDRERVRILLVEDNPVDAKLLRAMLTSTHEGRFTVTVADRLAGALKVIRANPPDAVLLDLSLPDSQGLATITRIRTAAPLLPIIVLTGQSDGGLARDAFRAGIRDYIVKDDVTAAVLLRTIRHVFEGRALEDAKRVAETRLWATLHATPDFVFCLSADGSIEPLSPATPLHEELLTAERLEDIVSADAAAALVRRLRQGMTEGQRVALSCSAIRGRVGPAVLYMACSGGSTIVVLRRDRPKRRD